MDAAFALDMCISCNTCYFDERLKRWIKSRAKIVRRCVTAPAPAQRRASDCVTLVYP